MSGHDALASYTTPLEGWVSKGQNPNAQRVSALTGALQNTASHDPPLMMIVLLLFLQKQNLANAIYLFGLGTLLSGLGLKHMLIRSHHDLAGTLVTPYS
jgi:hypothetical protein